MIDIFEYLNADLIVLAVGLYVIGNFFKKSRKITDNYIPLLLLGIGIVLSLIYHFATIPIEGYQSIMLILYTGITRGSVAAFASTYVNQVLKQLIRK